MTNVTGSMPTMQLPEGAGQQSPRDAGLRRLAFAFGLLVVAVVSGFIWWLIRHEPTEPMPSVSSQQQGNTTSDTPVTTEQAATSTPSPATVESGDFTFTSLAPAQAGAKCSSVSYGKVKSWFRQYPCERVVRGLYSTEKDDARAVVSIVVVTMPTDEQAAQLKGLTDTSGTGNVSDLLRDGTVSLPGTPRVAGGNYASQAAGDKVTIIESAFYGEHRNQALLDEITAQGLEVATHLN